MDPLREAVDEVNISIGISLRLGGLVGVGHALSSVGSVANRVAATAEPASSLGSEKLTEALVVIHGLVVAAELIGLLPNGAGNVAQLGVSASVFGGLGKRLASGTLPRALAAAQQEPLALGAGEQE